MEKEREGERESARELKESARDRGRVEEAEGKQTQQNENGWDRRRVEGTDTGKVKRQKK